MELHLGTCGMTWQHLATSNFISKDAGSNQSLQDENSMLGVLNLSKPFYTYLTSLILSHPISSYLYISPLASLNPSCWWGIVPCCHLPRWSRVQLRQIECLRQSKQHPVSFRRCWSLVNLTVSKYFHFKKMLTYVDIIQALIYVDICWY